MKTLIGGAIAAVLGLIGISVWFQPFLQVIAGTLPIMLLLGGCLALYLGFDELKDSWKKDGDDAPVSADNSAQYQEEIERLKKEVEELKAK